MMGRQFRGKIGQARKMPGSWMARTTLGFAAATATLFGVVTSAGVAQASAYDVAPAEYARWIDAAIPGCTHPAVTRDLIAAQLNFASGFDQRAVSASGAQGPAQYTPGAWNTYGRDGDLDGASDPFNIGDAVTTLVNEDCTRAQDLELAGKPADTASITAAWFGGTALVDDPYVREQIRPIITQL